MWSNRLMLAPQAPDYPSLAISTLRCQTSK
jgi:hypothetical protein